jgi:hypothetical protein
VKLLLHGLAPFMETVKLVQVEFLQDAMDVDVMQLQFCSLCNAIVHEHECNV